MLCSDTTVALGRTIYGKPEDAKPTPDACCGAVWRHPPRVDGRGRAARASRLAALSTSRVTFAAHDARGHPPLCGQRRAHGQGRRLCGAGQGGGALFRRISGSYSGIMGLPMFETAQLLREAA
jgi:septum formation protein